MSSTLDAFVRTSKPPPTPAGTSQEIRDRGSLFVANIFRASTEDAARKAVAHLRNVVHGQRPATHEMSAWRCMVLKPGSSGLGGPDDFELRSGSEDDGEKYGGGRILRVMEAERILDAVVVVSRWYGGEMLGPMRFAHIETCARDVCRMYSQRDEIEELIATLTSLDDILGSLRADLAVLEGGVKPTPKKQDYKGLLSSLDVAKAKRLVSVRERSIASVKDALQKDRTSRPAEVPPKDPETISTS